MACFPASFGFRHVWRPYQQRVLDAFERHLLDGRFHIAAAPGAGKTVLGLEALRRLQRPALVLAPTIAIRDQWLLRLRDSFLAQSHDPDWLSLDLERPSLLTLATYQTLHASRRRLGMPALSQRLAATGLGTLVLDEAHHLRQQWWQCLVALEAGLEGLQVIALTATPPFDVPQQEWNRYIGLCGPLDAEVAVPGLVHAGSLCPHQDYIYFSRPVDDEQAVLVRFDREVRALLAELALDRDLVALLAAHPLVRAPLEHVDALAERGDHALAIALYLHAVAAEHARPLLQALGLHDMQLPTFHLDWAERLLDGMLFDRDPMLDANAHVLQRITRRLRLIGAVEQRRVHLRAPPHLLRLLESSRSKCDSVAAIIELEARSHPFDFRGLVLCDHIREADFPSPGDPAPAFGHIGVVPVFEHLRRLRLPDVRLGVLTGSVIVVPQTQLDALRAAMPDSTDDLRADPLWHAPGFLRLDTSASNGGALLAAMTRLFDQGDINLLVGTAALLGEGWDAPALSTLVLASTIRASMRTNQMRGRAIRVQPGNPYKASNIWHLACLHPAGQAHDGGLVAGADLERLDQRFRSFAGVAMDAPMITNGIARLALDADRLRTADCDALNARMCSHAVDRDSMRRAWSRALDDRPAGSARMVLETRVPLRWLSAPVRFEHGLRWERFWLVRWFRARQLRRRLSRIAGALLQAMCDRSVIASTSARIDVTLGDARAACRVHGTSTHEEAQFADALREMFELPQSPRYLLRQGASMFAVPTCLGSNREQADALRFAFSRRVGPSELVYARNPTGRLALLRARERWLAQRFDGGCDTGLLWG